MTDAYDVEITRPARRQLQRLPPRVIVALVEFITTTLPENPARMSKMLTGELAEMRSARRGDYRVLFVIDESKRKISVVRVGHRSDVYRPE